MTHEKSTNLRAEWTRSKAEACLTVTLLTLSVPSQASPGNIGGRPTIEFRVSPDYLHACEGIFEYSGLEEDEPMPRNRSVARNDRGALSLDTAMPCASIRLRVTGAARAVCGGENDEQQGHAVSKEGEQNSARADAQIGVREDAAFFLPWPPNGGPRKPMLNAPTQSHRVIVGEIHPCTLKRHPPMATRDIRGRLTIPGVIDGLTDRDNKCLLLRSQSSPRTELRLFNLILAGPRTRAAGYWLEDPSAVQPEAPPTSTELALSASNEARAAKSDKTDPKKRSQDAEVRRGISECAAQICKEPWGYNWGN
ncbi:hypothetical protein DFH06DRAFT_1135685 [Mycena polygramma]|nr:hypothetical protein DFH06DRAFT_1135685 [Mycena polygramma]